MKRTNRLVMAACGLGLASALIGTGVASADPTGTPPANGYDRVLQGGGSDTTEEVMNSLAEVITSPGGAGLPPAGDKMIASWNATGGAMKSRATGCEYTAAVSGTYVEGRRPNGSGQGISALKDAFTSGKATFGCLDFARSSSGPGSSANTPNLTYIPFAKDAVALAVLPTSSIPRQLTFAEIKAMYTCTYPGFTGSTPTRKALLPQAGSGTRSFWLGKMGLTEAAIAVPNAYPCLSDRTDLNGLQAVNPGGTGIQEHQGRFLKSNAVLPISIAQYIAQAQGASTDFRGAAILTTVTDGGDAASYPMALNVNYSTVSATNTALNGGLTRDVYNVVPTSTLSDADVDYVFTGSDSAICANAATILKAGFGVITNCGDTSLSK